MNHVKRRWSSGLWSLTSKPYLDGAQRGGRGLHVAAHRFRHRLHSVCVNVLDLHRQNVHVGGEGAHCVGVAEAADYLHLASSVETAALVN